MQRPVSHKLMEGMSLPCGTSSVQNVTFMTEVRLSVNVWFFWPFSQLVPSFVMITSWWLMGEKYSPDSIRIVYCLITSRGTRSLWLRQTRTSRWPDVCCCEHWWDAATCGHQFLWAFNETPSFNSLPTSLLEHMGWELNHDLLLLGSVLSKTKQNTFRPKRQWF